MKKKTVRISPRVKVEFDPSDSATPVMVYRVNGKGYILASATFFCVADVGELSGSGTNPDYYPTPEEMEAIHKLTDEAEAYYEFARKDDPEYNRD